MPVIRVIPTLAVLLAVCACNTTNTRDHQDVSTGIPEPSSRQDTNNKNYNITLRQAVITENITADKAEQASKEPQNIQAVDIWQRIRQGLVLTRDLSKKSTRERIAWYARNQDYLDRVVVRAQPYIYYVLEQLERRNMPMDLALLPVVESAYHPFAYSPSHASGIWQFIPSTGKRYGLKQNWWYDGRRDIIAATDAALNYLQELHREFNGDWLLALAAYNTGERRVARAVNRNIKSGKATDFWSLRLPRETRGYVPGLLAIAEIVANSEQYNIKLNPIPNTPYFAETNIKGQIDLAMAAELADLTIEDLYTLNPAFNRWATDPDGPHRLLIPQDKKELFETKLSQLPDDKRIKWQQHRISEGETLGGIAMHYDTDVSTLKQINRLRGHMIRAGRSLLIPVASKSAKYYSLSLDSRRFKGLKRTGDGEKYIYTVKRGDTLWDIGRHYGISVKQLTAWNGISSRSILRPGKKLAVWVKQTQQKNEESIVSVATHSTLDGQQHVNYTVKEGDSLWLISKRYGVSVKQLQKWNSLHKRSILRPGQNIDIYLGKPPADV